MKKTAKIFALVGAVLSLLVVVLWQLMWSASVSYYVVSVSLIVVSMLPFFVRFEQKNISAREVTLVATFIALAVVSRAAFYLIPQVKPIAAVVIVSGVCLGAERGYVIGAFSAFISNFIFSQGYWTPFQMVALGLVGFVAGALFHNKQPNKFVLAVTGFLLAFALYGLIVDASTIMIMYGDNITLQSVLATYLSGVPFSLVFGISTAVFLLLFAQPFVKKVNRVVVKYDILANNQ